MPMATTAITALTWREPGKTSGWLGMTPCSLPAAISDPENVTAPMITSSRAVTVVDSGTPAAVPASRV